MKHPQENRRVGANHRETNDLSIREIRGKTRGGGRHGRPTLGRLLSLSLILLSLILNFDFYYMYLTFLLFVVIISYGFLYCYYLLFLYTALKHLPCQNKLILINQRPKKTSNTDTRDSSQSLLPSFSTVVTYG